MRPWRRRACASAARTTPRRARRWCRAWTCSTAMCGPIRRRPPPARRSICAMTMRHSSMTAFPTTALCVTAWAGELPHHYQLPGAHAAAVGSVAPDHRPDHRRGAHRSHLHRRVAATARRMPPGAPRCRRAILISPAPHRTDDPPETTSYRQLLFAHNIVIMDPTPTNPSNTITESVGPYLERR